MATCLARAGVAYLNDDTVEANARFFDGDTSKVPKSALTVGVGTVMDATEVVTIWVSFQLVVVGVHSAQLLKPWLWYFIPVVLRAMVHPFVFTAEHDKIRSGTMTIAAAN